MKIIRYKNSEHKDIWDHYIQKSNNGTIFHLRNFLSYHRERSFKDCSFMFYKKGNIEAVFTGAIINNCLHSHPGASFGGFVYNELSFPYANQIVDGLIMAARKLKLIKIVIIPPPFVYYKKYNETMEYCLYSKGFNNIEYYISSFVNLENNLINQMHDRKKRYIKKMQRRINEEQE